MDQGDQELGSGHGCSDQKSRPDELYLGNQRKGKVLGQIKQADLPELLRARRSGISDLWSDKLVA